MIDKLKMFFYRDYNGCICIDRNVYNSLEFRVFMHHVVNNFNNYKFRELLNEHI